MKVSENKTTEKWNRPRFSVCVYYGFTAKSIGKKQQTVRNVRIMLILINAIVAFTHTQSLFSFSCTRCTRSLFDCKTNGMAHSNDKIINKRLWNSLRMLTMTTTLIMTRSQSGEIETKKKGLKKQNKQTNVKNGNKMKIESHREREEKWQRTMFNDYLIWKKKKMKEKSVCFMVESERSVRFFPELFSVWFLGCFLSVRISNRELFTHSMNFISTDIFFVATNCVFHFSSLSFYECVNFNQWMLLFHCH